MSAVSFEDQKLCRTGSKQLGDRNTRVNSQQAYAVLLVERKVVEDLQQEAAPVGIAAALDVLHLDDFGEFAETLRRSTSHHRGVVARQCAEKRAQILAALRRAAAVHDGEQT